MWDRYSDSHRLINMFIVPLRNRIDFQCFFKNTFDFLALCKTKETNKKVLTLFLRQTIVDRSKTVITQN